VAVDGRRHVLAIGGLTGSDEAGSSRKSAPLLLAHAAQLSGAKVPKICFLNTAIADDPGYYVWMYQRFAPLRGLVSHLALFPMPSVSDPADLLLSQDVIFVGGGSVANMLAVWRVHGLDVIMRTAWEAGIVMSGVSAGAICWFFGGTTDSFGPVLRPFTDGLGLLDGSYCPHYDSELGRRPLFQSLIADGTLPAGIACDDGTAAHFADNSLHEVVADRGEAHGYLVERDEAGSARETRLPTRLLTA
jgi:peptidase E